MPTCSPPARTPGGQACSVSPSGPEVELTISSFDSIRNIRRRRSNQDFPLEFLPCSAPSPEQKVDKGTEIKPELLAQKPVRQEKSETDILEELKADKLASKAEKRASKAEKSLLKAEKSAAKAEKAASKSEKKSEGKRCTKICSKTCPKDSTTVESLLDPKAPKGALKAATKEPPTTQSKTELTSEFKDLEPVRDAGSNLDSSAKSAKSNTDNSLAQDFDPCFPPCLQQEVQDVAMGKEEKEKKKKKPKTPKPAKPPKPPKEPKLERKSSAKTKNTKPKTKDKEKKKKPEKIKRFEPKKLKNNPTFTQIGGSVGHNCCSCVDAMALYMKEFLRFSCSLTTGHPAQDTEFQERVCDILHIMRTMCRDCFYFVRYVLRLLFVD